MEKEFEYLADKHLYFNGEVIGKVSGTINHRDGYATVTRFRGGQIVEEWTADTTSLSETDRAMVAMITLPFGPGPTLQENWKTTAFKGA